MSMPRRGGGGAGEHSYCFFEVMHELREGAWHAHRWCHRTASANRSSRIGDYRANGTATPRGTVL